MDSFVRVNLKTYLGLLPDLSPIPKSAYGCCQYYTVIESFTETDQANVYQEIPFNPQIQRRHALPAGTLAKQAAGKAI